MDRKTPSPEAFLGRPWSSWIDAAQLCCSDDVDLEEDGKERGQSREVTRLSKEDMHVFGHYPARDDFYLVVCSACDQVVKPQVFQSHCERRHGSMCRLPASRASLAQDQTKACVGGQNSASSTSKPFETPKRNLLTSGSKQHAVFPVKRSRDKPRILAPVVSLEEIPNLVKARGAKVKMTSTTTAEVTSRSTSASAAASTPFLIKQALMPQSVPPPPEKISNGRGTLSATIDKKPKNGTTNDKPHKRLSEAEFEANKPHGVLDPETKKSCTRSPICKTHSLGHQRAVSGQKKHFDLLLVQRKAKSRGKEVKERLLTSAREVFPKQSGPAQGSLPGSSGSSGPEPEVASPANFRPPNSAPPRPSSTNSIKRCTSSNHSGCAPEPPLPPVRGDLASRQLNHEGEMD
uniref:SCA7 domain-containing protein n=1 Tax=Rousettus aegyptiacus TaxID=9407 RepID=A0A7J8C2F7_ROUAE|nr:hypothetical protein HJG63_009333 [Rousettus aegyptiacus]